MIRQRNRQNLGFTLTELITVIAIIAIVAAIAFVAVSTIQKNLQQAELDGTAREIFVAAQNHLSAADVQGTPQRKSNKGTQAADSESIYYYVVGDAPSKTLLDPASNAHYTSVLYQMLPFGSLDDTIRINGTYIIEYDLDSATVLGVFYARSNQSSLFAANTDGFVFQDADHARLFPDYQGATMKAARQTYASASGQEIMVGYYGGEDLDAMKGNELKKPLLSVVNADRLMAIVTNPNYNIDFGKGDAERLRPTLKLIVMGETSKAAKQITLVDNDAVNMTASYVESYDGGRTFYVFLDDITVQGGHFAEIFGPDGFIPGENIRVQALTYSSSKLANVAQSSSVHRNSLFSSLKSTRSLQATGSVLGAAAMQAQGAAVQTTTAHVQGATEQSSTGSQVQNARRGISGMTGAAATGAAATTGATGVTGATATGSSMKAAVASGLAFTTVRVANIRHLENVSGNVSGYDPEATEWGGAGATAVEQTRDLSWADFQKAIVQPVNGDATIPSADMMEAREQAAAEVRTVELSTWSGPVRAGSFMPVSPLYQMDYDGRSHRIEDVSVSRETGNVGVFGDVSGATIHDLTIVNANIVGDAGDAGGAIGAAADSTLIENVLVCNEVEEGTDAAFEIRGSRSTGGLVGSLNGGAATSCAAAVYVHSTESYAGGLIGWVGGDTALSQSYAGGHTQDGHYSVTTDAGSVARFNVIAAGNAGGLVGNAASANLVVQNCYSTASATGDIAGGLVGYINGGSLENCYATGLVQGAGESDQGALIGACNGTALVDNAYLRMVNDNVPVVGSGEGDAEAADTDIATYAAFADGAATAYPYDAALAIAHAGTYPYHTIAALGNIAEDEETPVHIQAHIGDWPMAETLVVNTPA